MLWQAEDGFRFRLLGGYAVPHPDIQRRPESLPERHDPPEPQQFLAGQDLAPASSFRSTAVVPVSPELVATTRTVCPSMTFDWSSWTAQWAEAAL